MKSLLIQARLYLWPENSAAALVIVALILLFLFWFFGLIDNWRRVAAARKTIRAFNAIIGSLSEYVTTFASPRDDEDQRSSPESEYNVQVAAHGLPLTGPVTEHVGALFFAGCYESRTDPAELTDRTIGTIGRGGSWLRLTIGIFVIIGLVGTLFGLSDAVITFRNLTASPSDAIPAEMFASLKGAFAPSICGVLFSVLASAIFALGLHSKVLAFGDELRDETQRVWVPKLMPSRSQRITAAADQTLAAAGRIVVFARQIETRTQNLDQALDESTQTAKAVGKAMSQVNQAVQTSSASVTLNLKDVDARIGQFSRALLDFSEVQSNTVIQEQRSAELLERLANNAAAVFEVARAIPQIVDELRKTASTVSKPFEEAAREMRDTATAFETTYQRSINDFETGIERKLKEIVDTQTATLDAVKTHVSTTSEMTRTYLEKIQQSLSNLRSPFEQSAQKLQEQASMTIAQSTESINFLERTLTDQKTFLESFLASWEKGQRPAQAAERPPQQPTRIASSSDPRMDSILALLHQIERELADQRRRSGRNGGPEIFSESCVNTLEPMVRRARAASDEL